MIDSGIDTEWCEGENAIEWIDGDKKATLTLHGEKLKNRVMKLAENHPEEVKIKAFPKDNGGYLLARIPISWIKINPPAKRSDDQISAESARIKAWNERNSLSMGL